MNGSSHGAASRWGTQLLLITAGLLLSANTAMAVPQSSVTQTSIAQAAVTKSPIKVQPAYRQTLQAISAPQAIAQTVSPSPLLPQAVPTVSGALADGIYFFGAAPERDQLGTEYIVFEVDNAQVVGAFYLPSSNFDCFQGEVQAEALALRITDSYDQAVHSYDLAMETVPTAVAGRGAGSVGPSGFYALGEPSDLEHGLLTTCQANYADVI